MRTIVTRYVRVGLLRGTATGFTLVEAVVAIGLAAIAGSALLLGINGSLNLTDGNLKQTIAIGLAQQLMDEVVGTRYMDLGASPYPATIGPSTGEQNGGLRQSFNDIGDFNGIVSQPPVDTWAIPLGADDGQGGQRHVNFQAPSGYLSCWQQQVNVYYVSETDLTTPLAQGQTSDYRLVQVRILYIDPKRGPLELAKLQRVVAYVPPL